MLPQSVSDTIDPCGRFGSPRPRVSTASARPAPCRAWHDAGEPDVIPGTGDLDDRLLLVGRDERGVQLEVIAIEQPDHLLVIHVMPYAYRPDFRSW